MFRALAAGTLLAALALGAAQAASIGDLRWKNRILVLSATERGSDALAEQERSLMADRDALTERDLLIIAVEGGTARAIFGTMPRGEDAASLRSHLEIDPAASFQAVLVGKDGGVKWRANAPVQPADIMAVIDSMPMRRAGRD